MSMRVVARIIDDVARRGDTALVEYTNRFDRVSLTAATLRLGPDEIASGADAAPPDTVAALELAAERIEAFHRRQFPSDIDYVDSVGVRLGQRWRPIAAVGLYVPGGTAAYPSSVLMNAIPARVAGVERLAMVVPAPDGVLNPLVLAAARLAGIDEIYRVGGAQADRGTGPWHRDDRAGRQDRRSRQRLCRGGQAAGLRPGRDRHDRRPVGNPRRRRPAQRSVLDRRRPVVAGRARRGRAVDPDRRRCRFRRGGRARGRAPSANPAAGRYRARELARQRRDDPGFRLGRGGDADRPHRPGAPRTRGRGPGLDRRDASAMPARSFSAATRRRRSAIMSPVPTMCCRPRAARGLPPGSAYSTS